MKNKKEKPVPPAGFVFQRYSNSFEDVIDGYSARAAELRVNGLNHEQVRDLLAMEIAASVVCFIDQGADEVTAVALLTGFLSESICRLSRGGSAQ